MVATATAAALEQFLCCLIAMALWYCCCCCCEAPIYSRHSLLLSCEARLGGLRSQHGDRPLGHQVALVQHQAHLQQVPAPALMHTLRGTTLKRCRCFCSTTATTATTVITGASSRRAAESSAEQLLAREEAGDVLRAQHWARASGPRWRWQLFLLGRTTGVCWYSAFSIARVTAVTLIVAGDQTSPLPDCQSAVQVLQRLGGDAGA